jgi:hypothetical protein
MDDFKSQCDLKGIRGWLTAVEWMRKKCDQQWKYSSAELLLANGHEWPFAPLPDHIKPGEKGECFRNATMLAIEHDDLTYCEGMAINFLFPVEHAWCVDRQGRVIDNTWAALKLPKKHKLKLDEPQYFGVAIKTSFLLNQLRRLKFYGMMYQPPKHPLFTLPPEKWLSKIKPACETHKK